MRTATRHAINEIVAHGHKINELKPSLLALFLDAELKAIRDVSEKRIWEKRVALLQQAFSSNPISAVVALPHDGNYYRHTQLQMVFDVLGITRAITVRKRHRYTIDEVVDNRNKIAHGDETPAEVGRRYSSAEVKAAVRTMKGVCERIVFVMSEHCSKPDRHCR